MKIALVQQNNKVGDVAGNAARMKAEIARVAEEYGAEVAVFGADAVTGGPLLGLGDSALFREQAVAAVAEVEAFARERGVRLVLADGECGGVVFRCAADHFRHGAPAESREWLLREARRLGRPVVWANAVGAQTDTIYYGGSGVALPSGEVAMLPLFEKATAVIDTATGVLPEGAVWGDRLDQLHGALVLGVRDYLAKTGVREACVAMSGGIDSALVLALAVEALGAERVKTIMLPSQYSTDHSVADSEEMIRRVGLPPEHA